MQRLLLGLCLVWIAALSATRAQGVLAEGTYGLASAASFSNSSAFAISPSLLVTEGVLEIDALGVGVLTSLRVEDGLGNEALLTIQFDVGYSFAANVINMAIIECTENVIKGPGFGFSLCAVANTKTGCARSISWGQGTVDTPFENRTLIVMANFCGLTGTQLWQCGAVGGCDAVPADLAEPALPIGNFALDGIPPPFIYQSPQSSIIALQTSAMSVFNNHEYMLMFTFAAGPVTIIARIYGAVVVDQASTLLFSFYNCSQAVNGGPAPVDVCVIMQAGGCETPVADSQIDLNPPQNETAIQLPNWCDFFSTIQYKCVGTCQAPVTRSSSGSGSTNSNATYTNVVVQGELSVCPGNGPVRVDSMQSCSGGPVEYPQGIITGSTSSDSVYTITAPSVVIDASSGTSMNSASIQNLQVTNQSVTKQLSVCGSDALVVNNVSSCDGVNPVPFPQGITLPGATGTFFQTTTASGIYYIPVLLSGLVCSSFTAMSQPFQLVLIRIGNTKFVYWNWPDTGDDLPSSVEITSAATCQGVILSTSASSLVPYILPTTYRPTRPFSATVAAFNRGSVGPTTDFYVSTYAVNTGTDGAILVNADGTGTTFLPDDNLALYMPTFVYV